MVVFRQQYLEKNERCLVVKDLGSRTSRQALIAWSASFLLTYFRSKIINIMQQETEDMFYYGRSNGL